MVGMGKEVYRLYLWNVILPAHDPQVPCQSGRIARDIDNPLRRKVQNLFQDILVHTGPWRIDKDKVRSVCTGDCRLPDIPADKTTVCDAVLSCVSFRILDRTLVYFYPDHLFHVISQVKRDGPGSAVEIKDPVGCFWFRVFDHLIIQQVR